MSKKPQTKEWDDPEESQRFLEAAKAAEASDDPKEFDRALAKVVPRQTLKRTS